MIFIRAALLRPAASLSDVTTILKDTRDAEAADLAGFDGVIHLAALSNDPLGNLNSGLTDDINHRASVRLAELAKEVGVPPLRVCFILQQLRSGGRSHD